MGVAERRGAPDAASGGGGAGGAPRWLRSARLRGGRVHRRRQPGRSWSANSHRGQRRRARVWSLLTSPTRGRRPRPAIGTAVGAAVVFRSAAGDPGSAASWRSLVAHPLTGGQVVGGSNPRQPDAGQVAFFESQRHPVKARFEADVSSTPRMIDDLLHWWLACAPSIGVVRSVHRP